VVDSLDKEAFDLQDAIDDGRATEDAYIEVFHRARAAMSLLWALHADAQTALDNALYEAITAVEDLTVIEPPVLAARARQSG
jgi:hypothetical protein